MARRGGTRICHFIRWQVGGTTASDRDDTNSQRKLEVCSFSTSREEPPFWVPRVCSEPTSADAMEDLLRHAKRNEEQLLGVMLIDPSLSSGSQ